MKKFNSKLILAFSILLVGLVMMALGNISKYFILVACVFLAVSCLLFWWEQRDTLEETTRDAEAIYADDEVGDDEKAYVSLATKKAVKRIKKLMVSLLVGAAFLIILGIVAVV